MYKFIDEEGREAFLSDAHEWVSAVRAGRVEPSTLVFDSIQSRWRQAQEMEAFQVAVASVERPEPTRVKPSSSEGQKAEGPVGTSDADSARSESPTQSEPVLSRKHGWQGVLYYWLTYIGAVILGVGAMAIAGIMAAEGEDGAIALVAFLLLAGLAVLSFFLARGVQRFESWARIVALILSYPSAISGFVAMVSANDGAEQIGGMASGILSVIFIVYFHGSKDLFDLARISRRVPPHKAAASHSERSSRTTERGPFSSEPSTTRFECPQCHSLVEAQEQYGEATCPECGRASLVRGLSL